MNLQSIYVQKTAEKYLTCEFQYQIATQLVSRKQRVVLRILFPSRRPMLPIWVEFFCFKKYVYRGEPNSSLYC